MGLLERHDVLVQRHLLLWKKVFVGRASRLSRADVYLWEAHGTSGYCISRDEIHVFYEENAYDLDHLDEAAAAGMPPPSGNLTSWRVWEVEVVHELVHEYQVKVVCGVTTAAGVALDKSIAPHKRFSGHGHDAAFYTAVDQVAALLGMSAQTLADNV